MLFDIPQEEVDETDWLLSPLMSLDLTLALLILNAWLSTQKGKKAGVYAAVTCNGGH